MNAAYFSSKIKELCADYRDAVTFGEDDNASKDLKKIQGLIDAFGIENRKNFDSAFFSGELNYNAGEKNVQYPDPVGEYKKRRKKRLDCSAVKRFKDRRQKRLDDKDDGQWITTDNGHHVHVTEDGEPDKGNPHVIAAMVNGDADGPRPSSKITFRKSVLESEQRESYNKRLSEAAQKMTEANAKCEFERKSLDKDQRGIPYNKKDFSKLHAVQAEQRKAGEEFGEIIKSMPVGSLLTRNGCLYEKVDGGWKIEGARDTINGGKPLDEEEFIRQAKCADYLSDVKPLECIENTNELKMVQSLKLKSDETYKSFADDINHLDKKGVIARAKKDPEFKELVDSITLFTQGIYTDQNAEAKYLVENGLDEGLLDTVSDYYGDGYYSITQLWNGQKLKESQSSFSGGVVSMIGAINNSEATTTHLFRVAGKSINPKNGEKYTEEDSLYIPPKVGDRISFDAPISFTKDQSILPELRKFKYGDEITYTLKPGAHALDIERLSKYKQSESITCGEYEVVDISIKKVRAGSIAKGGNPRALELFKDRIIGEDDDSYTVCSYNIKMTIRQVDTLHFGTGKKKERTDGFTYDFGQHLARVFSVKQYRERRKSRLDAKDDEDGRWVTTENDHHIHINEEGVPDKGNPHVLKAMTSGTKTREQIVRGRVQKTKSRVDSALKSYRDADEQVKKYAKEYYDKGTEFKHAQHRLDMIDKVYKKTLSDNGYEEKDGDRLRKEVDDLKKQLEADPYNSDLKGKFNNKNFLLAEWEDCYGEEAKQIRKDFDGLKRDSEAAKKELQKHLDARKSALSEARKAMGERDAQSMKFYSDDERKEIKESVINSDGFQNLNDDEKAAISASLDNASDAQIAMLKKSSENVKIMRYEDTAATTGCSHYSSGSGCMYLEEEDRKNPKVFWHEYGHYMDDFRHSGLEDNVVTYGEGSPYESHSSSFSDILESDVHIRGEDAVKDIQEMLDGVSPGRFEVVTNSEGTYLGVRDQKVGTYTDSDINLRMDLQRAFDKVVDNYLDGGENGGEIAEYYRSIGYPLYEDRPNRDDYIESYTTPKRKLEREREKYKGAEEEYYKKLNEYYAEQDRVKAEHPDFHDKVNEIYDRKREREKHISAVTDCLCGVFGGETFSIYGCHDPNYYKTGRHVENEWSANIHQMMFMRDTEAIGLLSKLMPRTMKKVKSAYNEYLWRNMAI